MSLTADPTYLSVAEAKDPVSNYIATLPNGNRKGQNKRILIPSTVIEETQTWTLQGTFVNASSYTFDGLGFNALFEWDGGAWHFMGGNALAVV